MKLTKEHWVKMLDNACELLAENADELSKMDAAIGDGDHGVSIRKIALVIKTGVGQWPEDVPVKEFFEDLSSRIMSCNGGSSGPLWGTLFAGFANGLDREGPVAEQEIKKMFTAGLQEMRDISTAGVGDKTLMDSLIPAVEAVENSREDLPVLLRRAAMAAKQGAENTKYYIAKYGRAKNIKEKSIGHKDPGAASLSLLFEGMANSFE